MEIYSVMAYTLNINDKSYNILYSGFALKNAVGAEGKHRASSCSVSVKGEDILSSLMYAEDYLNAVVKDEEGNILFTGVIRPYSTVSVLQTTLDAINIEILDYTEKLHLRVYEAPTEDVNKKEGIVYTTNWDGLKVCDPSDTSNSIVHKLCALAGISNIEAPEIPYVIFRFTLDDGNYLDDLLSGLLYEYIHDFRFDENGKMIIFQSGPIITGSDSEGDAVISDLVSSGQIQTIGTSLDITRNDDKRDGVVVKYGKYATKENVQIFTETRSGWSPIIDVDTGWWREENRKITWDKTLLNNIKAKDIILSNWWIEFKNESWGLGTTILYSKALSNCSQEDGYASWEIGAVGGILFNKVKARISIYADASYLLDEQGKCGIEGTNTESYTASYLFSLEKASSLASAIYARGKRSQFTYSFKSQDDLSPGLVYDLEELSVSGLNTKIRILTKEQSDVSGIYKYTAEGYGNISFTEPTFVQEREDAKWAAMDMLELQLSKDEVVLKNDDPVEALVSGLLIQKYGETPNWYINNSPLNDETSVYLSITKDQLRIGPNILKVEVEHDGQTYKLERKISYITADDVVQIEFTVCEEDVEPDENSVWVKYQPVYTKGQSVWVRIMTVSSDDWIVLRWTGIDGSDGVGISSVIREYAVSDSNTSSPNGGWQEAYPTRKTGEYVWARDKYTYTNSTVAVTVPYICSGEDGKLLSMDSDSASFHLDKEGIPYPNQISSVTVNKQGIASDTEFSASNGMKIADNSTEFKVTPYMLGAKFRMKNLVPSNAIYAHNTRKGPNTTVTYIDTLQYDVLNFYENGYRGRKIYIRCTYWANRNKEEGEVIGTFSFSPGNLIPVFDAPEISTTKNTVSKVYTIPIEPQTVTNRIGYYIGSTTYTTTSILKDIETYRDQTMIIDVNELEEAFPYFASLSDNEKKEILDTLPFFEDEFVLCGELRNLTPNPPYEWTDINGNLITITNQGESTLVSSTGIWNSISPGDLFPSNQRIFYKVTLSPTGDYTSYIFSVERQDSVGVSPSNQVRVLTSDSRETYSVLAKTINDNSKIILMNYADSGKESFILIDNDVFAINLTESGWYTFFKLLGASDQDIYNWADSLPYFADTYDVPISPLTITATADDYTARVSFGYIQDGQDGQDGANGEDAKLLLLTSDVSSFSLLPNGSASPNEATVTVNKQGITEDTEFIASNGMNIPDNSTEFKVTPYSAGLAKFKLKNIFNDSEDITIVSNATATIADGYSYEIAKDTNQMVFRIKIVNFEKAIEYLKNGIILQFIPKNIVKGTSDYFVACYVQYGYRDVTNTIKYHRPVSTQVLNFSDGKKITIYFSQDQIFGNLYPNDFNNLLNDVFTINFEMRSYSVPMTLDVVNIIFAVPYVKLEDAFPYFASLSDNEKKEILDTLPYFEDEFELCQTLENRSNPDKGIGSTYYYKKPDSLDYDPDTFTITFNYNNDPSITTPQYVFLGQDNITHYPEDSGAVFYDRCEIDFTSSSAVSETTQLNRIFGNEVWTHLSGNTLSEINVPIKQYENGFHKRSFLGLTRSTNGTPVFSYLKANQLPELDGSSLRLRNIVLINLTMLGWYVYFKLIGASDNEIYQWCENLPVFKDTYDVPISPLKITATAGEHTASISIGVITNSNFEIQASPMTYAMTSRQYVKQSQVIELSCIKKNYTGSSKAVWTIPSISHISFSSADGSTVYDGTSRTGDTVYVLVETGCVATSFKATCSLEGLGTNELTVAGSYPEFKSEYLGTVDATLEQTFPTSTADGPIMVGDMVVYITEDAQGNKTSEYYVCTSVNENGVGTWVTYIADTHHNSELMISGIYDAIMSGSKNASMLSMVKQLVAQYIAAEYIRITGAIYGGSYNSDGSVEIDSSTGKQGKGFYLDKNGSAKMNDSEINGSFTASDDDGIIMQTKKTQISAPYTETNIDRYLMVNYYAERINGGLNVSAELNEDTNSGYSFRISGDDTDYYLDMPYTFEGGITNEFAPMTSGSEATYENSFCGKPILAWSEYTVQNVNSLNKTVTLSGDFSNVDLYFYIHPVWIAYPADDVEIVYPNVSIVGKETIYTRETGASGYYRYINVGTDYDGGKIVNLKRASSSIVSGDQISLSFGSSLNHFSLSIGVMIVPKVRLPYCKILYPEHTYTNVVEYLLYPKDLLTGGVKKIEEFTSFTPHYKLLGDNYQINNPMCYVKITDSNLDVCNSSGTKIGTATSPTQAMCDLGIVYTSLYSMLSGLGIGEYNTDEDASYFKINRSYDFTDVSRISVSNISDNGKSIVVYGHNSKYKPTEITSGTFNLLPGLRGSTVALSMSAIFSLQILSQLRGLYVAALLPSRENNDNVVDIGMTTDHFDNAYIDNIQGNVNSEGTTNKVWGAVAN